MNELHHSAGNKKLVTLPLLSDKNIDPALTRDELLKIVRQVEAPRPPEEVVDFTEENESVKAMEKEIAHLHNWLGWTTHAEPDRDNEDILRACRSAGFPNACMVELQARHNDWLDEQRTQEDARY